MKGPTAIKVTVELPFFLRLEGSFTVRYDTVCQASQIPCLIGQDVRVRFSRRLAGAIDKSAWPEAQRSTVVISAKTAASLPGESVDTFAIRNCLDIINWIVSSYQATTGEISNAGFVFPLGTSDMQLFAEIRVNGRDVRDRFPSHSLSTFPLASSQVKEFKRYLSGTDQLPLSRLFLTNAMLSLERGQYSLAVLQAATAVELRMTQVIGQRLKAAGWSNQAREPYERMTLGGKLHIPATDPRSLETYFDAVSGFAALFRQVRDDLTPLRNSVAHRGHLVSHDEANQAVTMASNFLNVVR